MGKHITERVSPAIQDYLKHCYHLGRLSGGPITMAQLAQAMHISAPSVTNMVKRLEELKLCKRTQSGKITLTSRGQTIALEVVRHHRLLETFLVKALGMDWADAHKEAEVLEHYISERFEHLIDTYLSNPTRDPHGEPIPGADGYKPTPLPPTLLDFPEKTQFTIQQIRSHDPQMLEYLEKRALTPGTSIDIKEIAPFNGPIAVEVNHQTEYLSREVAACIYGEQQ
jgi:DtxR family transcriptional regulator, Mn-dependent transcriptional regulator